jgi:hypothetical protein
MSSPTTLDAVSICRPLTMEFQKFVASLAMTPGRIGGFAIVDYVIT